MKMGSALAGEGAAFGVLRGNGLLACNVNGCSRTFAAAVVGTLLSLTVDLNFFAAAAGGRACTVGGRRASFTKASAGGFIRAFCLFTGYFNFTSGTKMVFIVQTGRCRTC